MTCATPVEALPGGDEVGEHRPRHVRRLAQHGGDDPVDGGQRIDLAALHRGDELGQRRVLGDRALDLRRGRAPVAAATTSPARLPRRRSLELPAGLERVAPLDERVPERCRRPRRGPPR